MIKPLILGDGLLGSAIEHITGWDVVSRKKNGIDICKPKTYYKYLHSEKWDTIINCIGHTDTWNNNKEPHWSTNYKSVIDLVNLTNVYNIKLVHISTDYVYWNSISCAKETDIICPAQNWYMLTKVLADSYVEAMSNNFLTIRTSFKPHPFPWNVVWKNIIGNFDYIDKIAPLIVKLIKLNTNGIYNVGTKTKTMTELARYSKPNILEIEGNITSADTSMNLEKLYATIK